METQIKETGLPSLEQLILQGGDDRLDLLEDGLNKYNVNPADFKGIFSRASCTCSAFSKLGYQAANELYQRLSPEVFDEVRREQTATIKRLVNYEGKDRFHVFYAPSGSDLCYYPLMFSKLIRPKRDIFNVITCPEELGSGSNAAFAGKFYFNRNQFDEHVTKDQSISDSLKIESATFPAREKDGEVVDHWHEIIDSIHSKYSTHSVTANLVIGSKSGIENNITVISKAPEDVLWTVDLCQFRASRVLINGLIGMNCCVMITGSKYYHGPPFSAIMLVPKTLCNRFQTPTSELIEPFQQIFSRYDIPEELPEIRNHLRDFRNYGLLLRWQAAIAEMDAMSKIDRYEVNKTISQWNDFVSSTIAEKDTHFHLMPGQESTNKTIISFRLKDSDGQFLCHDKLIKLYRYVCQQEITGIEGCNRVLFGQPVRYGDRSFIRLALGASDVRILINNNHDFGDDRRLIEYIETAVRDQVWN